ncbi:MAG: hypothetical protein ACRDPY_09755 [Streptosporangiaceae bacterium]
MTEYMSGHDSGRLDDSPLTRQQMPDTPASTAETACSGAGRPGAVRRRARDQVLRQVGDQVLHHVGDQDVCWRCGVPFAWTDEDALRRCAQLAARGAA